MKEKKSFLMYFDWEAPFDCLDDESLGELFRGIFKYAKNNEEPNFADPTLYIIFSFVKTSLDRDRLAYEEKCRKIQKMQRKVLPPRLKPRKKHRIHHMILIVY